MNKEMIFPEIQQYLVLLHPSDRETFEKIRSTYIDINLDTQYYSLLELYIELERWDDFNALMSKYVSGKQEEDILQNPYINYLYGRKELIGLNLLNIFASNKSAQFSLFETKTTFIFSESIK